MKWTVMASLVLLLAACAVRDPRCDSALRPIGKTAPGPLADVPAALPP
jgi:hypothetical protein